MIALVLGFPVAVALFLLFMGWVERTLFAGQRTPPEPVDRPQSVDRSQPVDRPQPDPDPTQLEDRP